MKNFAMYSICFLFALFVANYFFGTVGTIAAFLGLKKQLVTGVISGAFAISVFVLFLHNNVKKNY